MTVRCVNTLRTAAFQDLFLEASFLTTVWPVLVNHLAAGLLHGITVKKERTQHISADAFILRCPDEASFLSSHFYPIYYNKDGSF